MLNPQLWLHLRGFVEDGDNDDGEERIMTSSPTCAQQTVGMERKEISLSLTSSASAAALLQLRGKEQSHSSTIANFNSDDASRMDAGMSRTSSPGSSAWKRRLLAVVFLVVIIVALKTWNQFYLHLTICFAEFKGFDAITGSLLSSALGVVTTLLVTHRMPNLLRKAGVLPNVYCNRSAEQDDNLFRQLAQQQQDFRERISALLGSIGAPPLQNAVSDATFAQFDGNDVVSVIQETQQHLELVLVFVQSHVDFMLCLHEALELLRCGTSLLLGGLTMGSTFAAYCSVERIEKSTWARWFRRQQHEQQRKQQHQPSSARHHRSSTHPEKGSSYTSSFGSMPIAMPLLRTRIYTILKRQLQGLKIIIASEVTDAMPSACDVDCFLDDQPTVVTLALLRKMKADAGALISGIVSELLCSPRETNRNLLPKGTEEAMCSVAYLKSAVKFSAGNETTNSGAGQSLLCLQNKIETLQIALMAYQEELSSREVGSNDANGGNDNSVLIWWESIRKHSNSLYNAIEEINERLQDKDVNDSEAEVAINEPQLHRDEQPNVEYPAENYGRANFVSQSKSKQGDEYTTTLVFSGVAVKQPRRRRQITMPSAVNIYDSSRYSQQYLFDELRERLKAMPLANEVNVNHFNKAESHTKDDPGYTICRDNETDQQELRTNCRPLLTELFLNELKESIIGLPREANAHYHE